MNKHNEVCEAPICALDPTPNFKEDVIWYPGEKVCNHKPSSKWQKKQADINHWVTKGMFKNLDEPYTALILETRSI